MTESTIWETEHGPTLAAVVHELDASEHPVTLRDVMARTGLDASTVFRAMRALEHDDLVEWNPSSPPESSRTTRASGDARRIVGTWPSAENMADRLLAELLRLSETADDVATKGLAKRSAEALGGFSRDTLIALIGAAAGVAMTPR